MFKIHREFKKLNIGKVNISIKKKILNRDFSKWETKMAENTKRNVHYS